jgi:hypothetical protein
LLAGRRRRERVRLHREHDACEPAVFGGVEGLVDPTNRAGDRLVTSAICSAVGLLYAGPSPVHGERPLLLPMTWSVANATRDSIQRTFSTYSGS